MAHHLRNSAYHQLIRRLNKFPQGAPPSRQLLEILKLLFSEQEARWVSLLPLKVFTAEKASRAWGLNPAATRKILDRLCQKALLVDIEQNGSMYYCLPPPMAGFFEFSLMRTRTDIDQKTLAELFYRYINDQEHFARDLFALGDTHMGRVFVHEPRIPDACRMEVLDYERASKVIRSASAIGLSLCYCRHKMAHIDRACQAPLEMCLTLNITAAALIRNGHARAADRTEALDILQRAYDHNLVQFGENVRQQVNFICNCCKCCCEGMIAARRFALFHPVQTSNFLPRFALEQCSGCGQCCKVCPVDALSLAGAGRGSGPGRSTVVFDKTICLGCGLCARVCPAKAVQLAPRAQRTITPLNTAHRVVLMAIERQTLQHIVFDNQVLYSHRALAALLGVIFRLPPIKQILASKQLKSRYLEGLITRLKWQPGPPTPHPASQNLAAGEEQCSISI